KAAASMVRTARYHPRAPAIPSKPKRRKFSTRRGRARRLTWSIAPARRPGRETSVKLRRGIRLSHRANGTDLGLRRYYIGPKICKWTPVKIAQISPLIESVPPRLYGGTERVVAYLTDELVRQGHDVTLFASGDSRLLAQLVPYSR